MLGDQTDFVGRLRAVLPGRWFPTTSVTATTSATPILDGVLNGLASCWASLYALLTYVIAQTRIATAYGVFLDMISADFFGTGLPRLTNEQDAPFRARIQAALLAPKVTRAAMISALTTLTGKTPWIFEPARPADCGSYGAGGSFAWGGLAYGYAGGYGDLQLPAQVFIKAYRPSIPGIPNAAGYGTLTGGSVSSPIGAYGYGATQTAVSGTIEYGTQSANTGAFKDALIYQAVANTVAAGVTAWTQISN